MPRLHLISNRDEFLQRPTAGAHWWPESGGLQRGWILGGRDLRAGGSWLAINRAGRVAVLTNHRDGASTTTGMRSRGELVERWLDLRHAGQAPEALASRMALEVADFAGFNLLLFDLAPSQGQNAAWVLSNRSPQVLAPLEPGLHGLSNAVLNSPWPKTESLKRALGAGHRGGMAAVRALDESAMLSALRNEARAADEDLPATGIALDRERYLSPVFIRPPDLSDPMAYGTRTSSLLKVFGQHAELLECTWHPQAGARRFQFRLNPVT